MSVLLPLSKRSNLLCFVVTALLLAVHPSFAFGIPAARSKAANSAMTNQAASSALFMSKQRNQQHGRLPLVIAASASSSAAAVEESPEEQASWKDRLLKMSNIASMLCVIDCTVLPIVTVVLPLLGLAGFTAAQMEWLHHFGKRTCTCFVSMCHGMHVR